MLAVETYQRATTKKCVIRASLFYQPSVTRVTDAIAIPRDRKIRLKIIKYRNGNVLNRTSMGIGLFNVSL